jgi:hypothetical protein
VGRKEAPGVTVERGFPYKIFNAESGRDTNGEYPGRDLTRDVELITEKGLPLTSQKQ